MNHEQVATIEVIARLNNEGPTAPWHEVTLLQAHLVGDGVCAHGDVSTTCGLLVPSGDCTQVTGAPPTATCTGCLSGSGDDTLFASITAALRLERLVYARGR